MDSRNQLPQGMLQQLKVLSEHKKVIAGGLLFNKVSNESYIWLISNLSARLLSIILQSESIEKLNTDSEAAVKYETIVWYL